jgi:GntR family transcriptional regulator
VGVQVAGVLHDLGHVAARKPSTQVLSLEKVSTMSGVAEAPGIAHHAEVFRVVRLCSDGDLRIAVMTNYLPVDLVDLDEQSLRTGGLYQLLRRAGITLQPALQVIGARTATTSEAKLRGEPNRAAVLTMDRRWSTSRKSRQHVRLVSG